MATIRSRFHSSPDLNENQNENQNRIANMMHNNEISPGVVQENTSFSNTDYQTILNALF